MKKSLFAFLVVAVLAVSQSASATIKKPVDPTIKFPAGSFKVIVNADRTARIADSTDVAFIVINSSVAQDCIEEAVKAEADHAPFTLVGDAIDLPSPAGLQEYLFTTIISCSSL